MSEGRAGYLLTRSKCDTWPYFVMVIQSPAVPETQTRSTDHLYSFMPTNSRAVLLCRLHAVGVCLTLLRGQRKLGWNRETQQVRRRK